jgi:hypothetical protein
MDEGSPILKEHGALTRRDFLSRTSRRGIGLVVAGGAVPALLAACNTDDPAVSAPPATAGPAGTEGPAATAAPTEVAAEGTAIIDDVIDFALSSDEWEGDFGFVTLRLRQGVVDGNDVYFIRTDASDVDFAREQGLVYVPKLRVLAEDGLSGTAVLFDDEEQPVVLSSEPGREDYTPAWRVQRATWVEDPRPLGSIAEVQAAESEGALTVETTDIVINAALVKWSDGELPADTEERTQYLGPGQLLEPPDTEKMEVTFKLSQCFPASRYIVTDHSIAPAAEMTNTVFAPNLQGAPTEAGATGRTNVFMNGVEGPGPMGFQPSAFDLDAGDPAWSPYWDHFTYAWKDDATPRVLTSETQIHEARDAGELDEFPGMPDTNGEIFTVNCPVPVLALVSFDA